MTRRTASSSPLSVVRYSAPSTPCATLLIRPSVRPARARGTARPGRRRRPGAAPARPGPRAARPAARRRRLPTARRRGTLRRSPSRLPRGPHRRDGALDRLVRHRHALVVAAVPVGVPAVVPPGCSRFTSSSRSGPCSTAKTPSVPVAPRAPARCGARASRPPAHRWPDPRAAPCRGLVTCARVSAPIEDAVRARRQPAPSGRRGSFATRDRPARGFGGVQSRVNQATSRGVGLSSCLPSSDDALAAVEPPVVVELAGPARGPSDRSRHSANGRQGSCPTVPGRAVRQLRGDRPARSSTSSGPSGAWTTSRRASGRPRRGH